MAGAEPNEPALGFQESPELVVVHLDAPHAGLRELRFELLARTGSLAELGPGAREVGLAVATLHTEEGEEGGGARRQQGGFGHARVERGARGTLGQERLGRGAPLLEPLGRRVEAARFDQSGDGCVEIPWIKEARA